jgi:hypothetical protein
MAINILTENNKKSIQVRMVPELNTAALVQQKDRELVLFYFLQAISQDIKSGSQWLYKDQIIKPLVKAGHYTRRTLDLHLALGEGKLWKTHQNGSIVIEIYGLKSALAYLNTYKASNKVTLPASDMPSSRQLLLRRGILFETGAHEGHDSTTHIKTNKKTGAAIVTRTFKQHHPITRASLEDKTGIERRKQQRYHAAVNTERIKTKVKVYDPDRKRHEIAKREVINRHAAYDIPEQRGNRYWSRAEKGSCSLVRKVARALRAEKLCYSAEAIRQTFTRLYYDTTSDFQSNIGTGTAGNECWIPVKNNPQYYRYVHA